MLGFPTQLKYIFPLFILMLLCLAATVFANDSASLFVFNPSLIKSGEVWRIVTGQFIHSNLAHALLNCAGLLLVWSLHGEYYPYLKLPILTLVSSCAIGLCIFFFADYAIYYGLSGVIHFLLVWGAWIDIKNKEKTGYLLLVGMTIKVLWETFFGADTQTSALIDAVVATEAHIIGVSLGLIAGITRTYLQHRKHK